MVVRVPLGRVVAGSVAHEPMHTGLIFFMTRACLAPSDEGLAASADGPAETASRLMVAAVAAAIRRCLIPRLLRV
jgi:hypothetical protein